MTITKTTGFDPSTHGFHFRNRFSGLDILGDINEGFPDIARGVAGSPDFWDGWGLCGGMSWHALDRFYARNPVPASSDIPSRGSPLFRTLALRQFDSFRGAALLAQCLRWQSRADTRRWWDLRQTMHALTLKEWGRVKDLVDRGYPASLCLIRTTATPWENHQVVAVAYELDPAAGSASIGLYDPNHPDRRPTIRIALGGQQAGQATQSTGERLRGFFVWPYDKVQRSPSGPDG